MTYNKLRHYQTEIPWWLCKIGVSIVLRNHGIMVKTLLLCFNKYTQVNHRQLSTKVREYEKSTSSMAKGLPNNTMNYIKNIVSNMIIIEKRKAFLFG